MGRPAAPKGKGLAMTDDEKRTEAQTDAARSSAGLAADAVDDAIVVESTQNSRSPDSYTATVSAPRRRSGAFFGTVVGGILAAAAGFGLARVVPGGWPLQDTTALTAEIAAQSQQLENLRADLDALAVRPLPDTSQDISALRAELEERLAQGVALLDPAPAIAQATGALSESLAAVDARLLEVEKRPAGPGGGVSPAALAAYDRELQTLRDQIAAQDGDGASAKAEIAAVAAEAKSQLAAAAQEAERLKSEAAIASRAMLTVAALGRVRAAMEGGGPYASALADLADAGIVVPPELSDLAETGVPTLTDLQRGFPDAARAALDAALRSDVGDGWADRLTSFLRTQTGARSLEPREGTDPDAILSRAEAALSGGDVALTLTELTALSEPAQTALAPWVADVKLRDAALAAVVALTATVDAQ